MVELRAPGEFAAESRAVDAYLPIENYAAIGDGRSLALVSGDGSIDWMCLPNLDGPSVFAALLDPAGGGRFMVAPSVPFESRRRYLPQTNVLETEYRTAEGVVRVTDAFTIDPAQNAPWRELVRVMEGASGCVPMRWYVHPRFDYGQVSVEPEQVAGEMVYRHGQLQLAVKSWDAGMPSVRGGEIAAEFDLREGERAMLALLASDDAALPSPRRSQVERRLSSTFDVWRGWVSRTTYNGPFKGAVERSLLAIRLLADDRTGAIAAAGTTSLPEALGGKRNFDYRFGWVRDLSFTVDALLRIGMEELAHASVCWLLDAVGNTQPRVDPVYALTGSVVRSQQSLSMPGYRLTSPVRRGNQAGRQLQLGGFGDLLETISRYVETGHVLSRATGERLADSLDLLCSIWRQPDAGLWELGDREQYMTSKLGCWSAFDRSLALVREGQAPQRNPDRWRRERDAVREFIETHLWSEERHSYRMRAGSDALDCGVLLAARRGFTDPKDPRMLGTIAAIRDELHAGGPLFFRYSGMADEENAFLACSFWVAEAMALAGQTDDAAELIEGVLNLGGEFGLFSEEMEPGNHAMRGNYPQALTHLALISAADILSSVS
jgi:GH15 family glucan-1,4-alpha-glucosidase